jgi:hypothetical protein
MVAGHGFVFFSGASVVGAVEYRATCGGYAIMPAGGLKFVTGSFRVLSQIPRISPEFYILPGAFGLGPIDVAI